MADATIRVDIDASGARDGARVVKRSLDDIDGASEKTKAGLGALKAAFAALGVAQFTRGVLSAATELQKLKASLETVTGSAKNASIAFAGLQDFATKTPFQLNEVVNSFVKLQALGLKPSERALMSYGNTASSLGKSLDQAIEAVADAATGEFERLKEFGIRASSQADSVKFTFKGITTEVAKNSTDIQNYLIQLGETNFAGGMERQMDTIGGAMSNLEDAWAVTRQTISEAGIADIFEQQFRDTTAALNSNQQNIADWSVNVAEVIATLVDVVNTSLSTISTIFQSVGGTLGAGGAQLVLILQGEFDAARQVGNLWFEDQAKLWSDLAENTDTTRYRDLIKAVRERMKELSSTAGEAGKSLDDLNTSTSGGVEGLTSANQKIEDQIGLLRTQIDLIAAGIPIQEAALRADLMAKGVAAERIDELVRLSGVIELYQEAQENATKSTERLSKAISDPISDLSAAFGEFDGPFNQAIGRMMDSLETFRDAREAEEKGEANAAAIRARGYAQAISGLRGMADEGSAAYKVLTFASNAAALAAAQQAVATAATLPPPAGFISGAAMAAAMASIVTGFAGSFGGGSVSGALDTGNSGFGENTVLGDAKAQSESITNAIDQLADISTVGLKYTEQMATSLQNIEQALAGVASEFARVAGGEGIQQFGISGTFGNFTAGLSEVVSGRTVTAGASDRDLARLAAGVTQDRDAAMLIVSQMIEARDRLAEAAADPEAIQAMDRITSLVSTTFDGIESSLVSAVETLGGNSKAAAFLLRQEFIDLNLLEQEDIDTAINALFSGIADSAAGIADSVMVDFKLTDYQQVGEGLFETLVRVASGFEVVSTELARIGQSLDGIDVNASENLIALFGGIDEFAQATGSYIDSIYTDAEKLAVQQADLARVFDNLNTAIPESKAEFKDLVESLDLSTEAGQALYASLIEVAPLFSDVQDGLADASSAMDDVAAAARNMSIDFDSLTERLLSAQGLTDQLRAMQRQQEIDSYLAQLRSPVDAQGRTDPNALFANAEIMRAIDMLQQIYAAEDAARQAAGYERQYQDLQRGGTSGPSNADLAMQFLQALGLAPSDFENVLTSMGMTPGMFAQAGFSLAEWSNSLTEAQRAALEPFTSEILNLIPELEAMTDAAGGLSDAFKDVVRNIREYLDELQIGDFGLGTPLEKLALAQDQFNDMLRSARAGDLDAAQGLTGASDTLLGLAREVYASGGGYRDIYSDVVGGLNSVANLQDTSNRFSAVAASTFSTNDSRPVVAAIEKLEQRMSERKQPITIQIIGPDGKVWKEEVLEDLWNDTRNGVVRVHSDGVYSRSAA